MKKLKLNGQSQLQLKKDRITNLSDQQALQVAGGFTYSLSTGARCQESKRVGGQNPFDCGVILASSQRCIDQTVVAAPQQAGVISE